VEATRVVAGKRYGATGSAPMDGGIQCAVRRCSLWTCLDTGGQLRDAVGDHGGTLVADQDRVVVDVAYRLQGDAVDVREALLVVEALRLVQDAALCPHQPGPAGQPVCRPDGRLG